MPATVRLKFRLMSLVPTLFLVLTVVATLWQLRHGTPASGGPLLSLIAVPAFLQEAVRRLKRDIAPGYHDAAFRFERGIEQVATFWKKEDGSAEEFEAFVRGKFEADPGQRQVLFQRLEAALEQLDGHMNELRRDFRRHVDLDLGPITTVDEILSSYNPSAHLVEDMFHNRLSFLILLNFPVRSLEEMMTLGKVWSRQEWAEARLAQRFAQRYPASIAQEITRVVSIADRYVAEYNIWMHHLLDDEKHRHFPAKLRLISHWGLRDEIKALYGTQNALHKQRMIQQVFHRIVTQTIPAAVIDNPMLDWNPYTNELQPSPIRDIDGLPSSEVTLSSAREPDTRYAHLLECFRVVRLMDPFSPNAPTHILRRFHENREMPEARVRGLLEQVLKSPLLKRVGALISSRLGRPLEPFDIWYSGFRPRGKHSEGELDAVVSSRYPSVEAFSKDIPNILMKLGFKHDRAEHLAAHIEVDPSRGAGHAMRADYRRDKAHLRTRFEKDGMNYKGFNVAMHELGHNVEQVFSLNDIDHTLLQGVPNTAFTEAIAFVFQAHDLEMLGLASHDENSHALQVLDELWATAEIAGVALVDMDVWHWMYAHPDASPDEAREAVLDISRRVWNRFWAPIIGVENALLMGVYSHMIDALLYLPDYPLGHIIAFQIEEQIRRSGDLGAEVERMSRLGCLAPDVWMEAATGEPVTAGPLLAAAEAALARLGA